MVHAVLAKQHLKAVAEYYQEYYVSLVDIYVVGINQVTKKKKKMKQCMFIHDVYPNPYINEVYSAAVLSNHFSYDR